MVGMLRPGGVMGARTSQNPSLDLKFASLKTLDSRIAFARTGTAMVTGSDGLLGFAPHNLAINSNTFSDASWTKTRLSVAASGTHWVVTEDSTSSASHLVNDVVPTPALEEDSPYTFSVEAKASNRDELVLRTLNYDNASDVSIFDLGDGTVLTEDAQHTATITALDDGWYRCSVTGDSGNTTNTGFQLLFGPSSGNSQSYTGTGVESILARNVLFHAGPVLLPYNATTTAIYQGPRFEHGGIYRNLLLQSEDFSTTWADNYGTATITVDDTANPIDGLITADKIAGGSHAASGRKQTKTLANSTAYIFSMYLKNADSAKSRLGLWDSVGADWQGYIEIAWTAGVPSTDSSSGATNITYADAGNGWYRASFTVTSDATNTSHNSIILPDRDAGTLAVYIFGAMLELSNGRTAASPYIKTTTQTSSNLKTNHIINSGHTEGAHPGTSWTTGFATGTSAFGTSTVFGGEVSVEQSGTAERPALQQPVTLEANSTYTLSAYFESGSVTSGNTTVLSIASLTGDSGNTSAALPTTPGWRSITFTTAADVTGVVRVGLGVNGTATGSLIFSRVQLQQDSELSTYIPTTDRIQSTGLTSRGLVIEESRENIATYSQDFTQAIWANVRSDETAAAVTAPDGAITGNALLEDATATSSHYIRQLHVEATITDTVDHTFQCYLKKGVRTWAALAILDKGAVTNIAYFDLDNGVAGTVTGADASTIEDVGNGWFFCSVTADMATGAGNPQFLIYAAEADNDNSFSGVLNQEAIYMWQADVTEGSFPTSPIPTTTAAVARGAETAFMTGTNFSSWYNQSAGTLLGEFLIPHNQASGKPSGLFSLDDDTYQEFTDIRINSGGGAQALVADGGATKANITVSGQTPGVAFKSAIAFSLNDFAHVMDGTAGTPDTSGTLPTVTQFELGGLAVSTNYSLNGTIARITYWPTRKSNAYLQNNTA